MSKVLMAAFAALTLVGLASVSMPSQATATPSYVWYHGYKYYLSDYYNKSYCIHAYGYSYCRYHGSGGGSY